MQHHDLVPEYNVENSPVRKAFQMIRAIAFVDLGDVQDTAETYPTSRDGLLHRLLRADLGRDSYFLSPLLPYST